MAEFQAQAKFHTDKITTSEPDAEGRVEMTVPVTIDPSTITEMVTSDLPWNGWGVMWRHGNHDLLYPTLFDLPEQAAAFISLRADKETLRPVPVVVQAASAVQPAATQETVNSMAKVIYMLTERLGGSVAITEEELKQATAFDITQPGDGFIYIKNREP